MNNASKSMKKRIQEVTENDCFIADESRPLIPEGNYVAQCIRYEKGRSHHNSMKLFLYFDIFEGSYMGKRLFMAINLSDSKTGKEFKKVPSGSKLYKSWVIANNNQRPFRNRMPLVIFKNGIFEVRVRTVKPKFPDGRQMPECFHYSIVDYLIQRLP